MPAGGGGMVLTSCEATARQCRFLANQAKADSLDFVHETIGFNYRMPNLNAALALGQAEKLDEFLAAKRAIVRAYGERLDNLPGCHMRHSSNQVENAHWMAVLELDNTNAAAVIQSLVDRGIGARPTWRPLNDQAAFSNAQSLPTPRSENIYQSTICLPCSSGLTEDEIDQVSDAVRDVLG